LNDFSDDSRTQIEQKQEIIMDAISEYNKRYEFFKDITGEAMRVHRKYHGGLLESAYEAALKYVLEQKGYKVERQVFLPIYWDDVQLDQTYRMDLVINDDIIVELKAINHVDTQHRRQLWNYMNLTHLPYGMLINFSPDGLYSEWYKRDALRNEIDKIKLL
jgi:GxxExxY protein